MQQEQLNIREAETARIFEDRNRVRLLEPFIQEARTLSEAANKLGVKVPRLHYHIRRFLEYGLLEVARTEKQNGRTVKFYQTTAKDFFVRFELTSNTTLAELLIDLGAAANERFYRALAHTLQQSSSDWGVLWVLTDKGFYCEPLPKPGIISDKEALHKEVLSRGTPALFSIHTALSLEYETAKALQNDLFKLMSRYEAQQTEKAQSYSFRIGLTPVPDELKQRQL